MKEKNEKETAFVQALTQSQVALSAYLFMLTGDSFAAEDILQETNLYLWQNAAKYDPSRPFLPWAKTLAVYQLKKYRLYHRREAERLTFDDELVNELGETLAAPESGTADSGDVRLEAFDHCFGLLAEADRRLLTAKYVDHRDAASLALEGSGTRGAVFARLHRLRTKLYACIVKRMCAVGREP